MLNNLFPFKPCHTVYGALLAFRINETDCEVTSVFSSLFLTPEGSDNPAGPYSNPFTSPNLN